MKVFAKKSTALKYIKPNQILCNNDIKKYFILPDLLSFSSLIENSQNPCFYEFISDSVPVNLFLDIEIYKDKQPIQFNNYNETITLIKSTIISYFTHQNLNIFKIIILESHSNVKFSFHVILRLVDTTGNYVYFENVKELKKLIKSIFPEFTKSKLIDLSVYREGLFRTFKSSKLQENRPLIKNQFSDDFEFIESFVTYCPINQNNSQNFRISELLTYSKFSNSDEYLDESKKSTLQIYNKINTDCRNPLDIEVDTDTNNSSLEPKNLSEYDKTIIKKFIRKNYKYKTDDIREIIIDRSLNCIVIALSDKFCYNIDREHKSNHQYIVIDTYSSKQKCHDLDCQDFKYCEIKVMDFPKEINEIILKCLRVNKKEQELIEKAIQECKDYITQNFDEQIQDIQFDKNTLVFKGNASNNNMVALNGKCNRCKLEHHITNTGYCLKCSVCNSIYPKNQLIPVDDKYKTLNSFWMNYHQLINNGTVNININNFYTNNEEEFSCDIKLHDSIFRNKEMTKLYNQILDGHKVVLLSELMSKLEIDFKYTNGEWYFFNGSIWKQDKESLEFRKRILKLSSNFSRIQNFYESKNAGEISNSNIIKNVKSLVNKLHKTGFEDEIIKGAKMYYNDETFIRNLNSKKHLVPFSNGVYDLLEQKFRKTTKDDYVNLTVNYIFNQQTINPEVVEFINKVLPNKGVRDYVLKKMSECLNGDIPNTNFLMFIGDGANGKSQLLNLMKLSMGDLGEKVEVTLLTRKRNNANEANSEKIKLMYKRFAFLSEPEDGEKINIGLLKELTGSEEIVARGLYQEAVSFVMEAKLFLACNELPEIKGEDTALWRRIRVIDFPSRFVDDPKESNEFKIDRTLPSRMREDISWRQTFINILLDYYSKDIKEPLEVQIKTNEYREENNDFYNWCEENIEYKEGELLKLTEVISFYLGKTKIHSKESSKFKKELEKYIKFKYKNIKWEYSIVTVNDKKHRGWKDLSFVDK
jgi:P4 family phage/plasmid primase-like protien